MSRRARLAWSLEDLFEPPITYKCQEVHFPGPWGLVMSQEQTWFGLVAASSGLTAAGWVACAPLAALADFAPYPVEGGHRPQVGALVQQRRLNRGGRQVSEPVAVQLI